MVGFTPSISTAVWMGNDSPAQPIEDVNGRIIYGAGLPGAIWQEFMNDVLDGTPEEDLPDRALIRGDTGNGVPAPQTETRTQTPTQVTTVPTQEAEPTETATATPTPSTPTTSSAPTTRVTPTTPQDEESGDEEEVTNSKPPANNQGGRAADPTTDTGEGQLGG
jgi:membrane peptidoglycan carboxypeptidase